MSVKPRLSGIPAPGKGSAIPTPGRSRASSRATQNVVPTPDVDFVHHAFANALKANDPARHRTSGIGLSDISSSSLSPPSSSLSLPSGRRSVSGRPSSANSASSAEPLRAPHTVRSPAVTRNSDVSRRSASRSGRVFEVGDNVRIESLGFEGILKYVGEIDGKVGLWAGVELSGGFAGKGKNNGSVNQ
jgi:CAP-Gly domain-containing linker protein 1